MFEGFVFPRWVLSGLERFKQSWKLLSQVPQANSLFGWFLKGKNQRIMSFQCIFLRRFLKRACGACDYFHVCLISGSFTEAGNIFRNKVELLFIFYTCVYCIFLSKIKHKSESKSKFETAQPRESWLSLQRANTKQYFCNKTY